ncbi:putative molybdenum carrier protein [Desulfobacter curvatus]|uniref:putative molybdenum carrier protein n=1 Tax=Desulfobacter curvatus TaxID=2290 RepID=UPI00036955A5|nr:putative molybdenum carrier protein [Desulfobacter curvatus]
MIQKIISGAQTGADRAGIDAAIESGVEYGGWIPKGRKAEDGTVPEKYTELTEVPRGGYPKRTEQNVIDFDGTIIFTYGKLTTGSALTKKFAVQHKKPFLHIDLDTALKPSSTIKAWIQENNIQVLNVAGRSASKSPGIYEHVKGIICEIL